MESGLFYLRNLAGEGYIGLSSHKKLSMYGAPTTSQCYYIFLALRDAHRIVEVGARGRER